MPEKAKNRQNMLELKFHNATLMNFLGVLKRWENYAE